MIAHPAVPAWPDVPADSYAAIFLLLGAPCWPLPSSSSKRPALSLRSPLP